MKGMSMVLKTQKKNNQTEDAPAPKPSLDFRPYQAEQAKLDVSPTTTYNTTSKILEGSP